MKQIIVVCTLIIGLMACNNHAPAINAANIKTDTFKVWGNCSMCKKTIETALKTDGIATADWDKSSKILSVSYDPAVISLDQIQKNVAASGYDNEIYKGDDAAYTELPECCQYERK